MSNNLPKFIQHNDDHKRETVFQCPKCRSYNIIEERIYVDVPVCIIRHCEDCGYKHTTELTRINSGLAVLWSSSKLYRGNQLPYVATHLTINLSYTPSVGYLLIKTGYLKPLLYIL